MGTWVVGVIPDEEARALPHRYAHLVRPGLPAKSPSYSESLAWWWGGGDREPFFERSGDASGSVAPTPAAWRFADLVTEATTVSDVAEAMGDASLRLMPAEVSTGLFVATARKASPVAALYYGLGSEESGLLPGWFGDFLLSADDVLTALPRAEAALCLSGARRSRALGRIGDWMTAMGDSPDFDAAELIDAPLRVLRQAAETRSGVAALSRSY